MNIPFDVSYHFDDNLRDIPNSPIQMQQAVEYLQTEFDKSVGDIEQQIYLAGLIGGYARMLHDFKTAQQVLTTALNLCDRINNKRLKIVNSIRLAHLYQWQRQYENSEALLNWVLEQCQNNSEFKSYLDFAYQHFGKCKFDRAKYKEAEYYLSKALELRHQKGDSSLIDSTRLALEVVQQCRYELDRTLKKI